MHYLKLGLSCVLFLGCQGSVSAPPPADLATSPDLSTPTTVPWTTGLFDIQTMGPLSGVKVCIAPADTVCATTNAAGTAMLNVPLNAQFMLSYTLSGSGPQFTEHTSTTIADGNSYLMVSSSNEAALAGAVGKQIDPAKGNLVFSAIDATSKPLAGAMFTATPTGGDGPYYFGSSGFPDSTAKSASSNGLGFLLNLTPGDLDVTAAVTGLACAGSFNKSWVGNTSSSVKARVIAGGITTVSIACK